MSVIPTIEYQILSRKKYFLVIAIFNILILLIFHATENGEQIIGAVDEDVRQVGF